MRCAGISCRNLEGAEGVAGVQRMLTRMAEVRGTYPSLKCKVCCGEILQVQQTPSDVRCLFGVWGCRRAPRCCGVQVPPTTATVAVLQHSNLSHNLHHCMHISRVPTVQVQYTDLIETFLRSCCPLWPDSTLHLLIGLPCTPTYLEVLLQQHMVPELQRMTGSSWSRYCCDTCAKESMRGST
jgi:hypothetical protein